MSTGTGIIYLLEVKELLNYGIKFLTKFRPSSTYHGFGFECFENDNNEINILMIGGRTHVDSEKQKSICLYNLKTQYFFEIENVCDTM